MPHLPRPAIVLTSGGLDSTTCLAIARAEGFSPLHSLTFDYGQRHHQELNAAVRVARQFQVAEHRVIQIDLRQFGGSALTDEIEVPKAGSDEATKARSDEGGGGISQGHVSTEARRHEEEKGAQRRSEGPEDSAPSSSPSSLRRSVAPSLLPITYVPARNTIFLSYALAWAEVLGVADVFIGVNAIDYSGYPDCRPQFIATFQQAARLGTTLTDFTIHSPLIHLTKAQIIRRGIELGVDYSLTHSCYDPDEEGRACGRCDSCLLRRKGFVEAGVADPANYTSNV